MNLFNRKLLFQDYNAEAAAAVWSALKEAKIPYEVKSNVTGAATASVKMANGGRMGSMASGASLGSGMTQGVPQSWNDGGAQQYCYFVYVKKSDFVRAKAVCEIG